MYALLDHLVVRIWFTLFFSIYELQFVLFSCKVIINPSQGNIILTSCAPNMQISSGNKILPSESGSRINQNIIHEGYMIRHNKYKYWTACLISYTRWNWQLMEPSESSSLRLAFIPIWCNRDVNIMLNFGMNE